MGKGRQEKFACQNGPIYRAIIADFGLKYSILREIRNNSTTGRSPRFGSQIFFPHQI